MGHGNARVFACLANRTSAGCDSPMLHQIGLYEGSVPLTGRRIQVGLRPILLWAGSANGKTLVLQSGVESSILSWSTKFYESLHVLWKVRSGGALTLSPIFYRTFYVP